MMSFKYIDNEDIVPETNAIEVGGKEFQLFVIFIVGEVFAIVKRRALANGRRCRIAAVGLSGLLVRRCGAAVDRAGLAAATGAGFACAAEDHDDGKRGVRWGKREKLRSRVGDAKVV